MTKHHWTPDAVHELVKDWPDEARSKWCSFGTDYDRRWSSCGDWIHPDLAADLHALAGLRWLAMEKDDAIVPSICYLEGAQNPWTLANEIADTDWPSCPTLLHAVSAAIMAAGGAQ